MSAVLTRHRFTVDEYEEMIQFGIIDESHRVEFIRGEVLDKMSIGDPHAACVKGLNRWFGKHLPDVVLLGIQDPIRLTDSRPEPDVSLLVPRDDLYVSSAPQPADIYLLIEVADSSIDFDRDIKGPLYAENGIREYWIVNLNDRTLEVYRQPGPAGYAEVRVLQRGDRTDLTTFPNLSLDVDSLFH